MRICIYTAIYGNYDRMPQHVKQTLEFDNFVFTDNPELMEKQNGFREGYKTQTIVKFDPWILTEKRVAPCNQPVMGSVLIRCNPDKIPLLSNYDMVIYLDGNARITDPTTLQKLVSLHSQNPEITMFCSKHPYRISINQEAEISKRIPKYTNYDFAKQLQKYQENNYDINCALMFWNGFVTYFTYNSEFNDLYTEEMFAYCINSQNRYHPQGQVSLPYCLIKCNIKFLTIPDHFSDRKNGIFVSGHN